MRRESGDYHVYVILFLSGAWIVGQIIGTFLKQDPAA
jgi:hypothetical protein